MTQEPGRESLIEHELDEHVTTPRQDHRERPGAPQGLSHRVEERTHFAEIDLRDFTRRGLEAHEHFGRLARFDLLAQAIHR